MSIIIERKSIQSYHLFPSRELLSYYRFSVLLNTNKVDTYFSNLDWILSGTCQHTNKKKIVEAVIMKYALPLLILLSLLMIFKY